MFDGNIPYSRLNCDTEDDVCVSRRQVAPSSRMWASPRKIAPSAARPATVAGDVLKWW